MPSRLRQLPLLRRLRAIVHRYATRTRFRLDGVGHVVNYADSLLSGCKAGPITSRSAPAAAFGE